MAARRKSDLLGLSAFFLSNNVTPGGFLMANVSLQRVVGDSGHYGSL